MSLPNIITIDGTAASGKSTLAMKLAKRLGYLYFDTGVTYRSVTWKAIREGFSIQDEFLITNVAKEIQIDVRPPSLDDGRGYDVIVDGQDVTWNIRESEVDANVSIVAAYPGVRQALTGKQRQIGLRGKCVMVGRDIGTVVLPEAELKIYLKASVEIRAKRRFDECTARKEIVCYDEILESMKRRDQIDQNRAVAPLRPAEDANIILTDDLDAEQLLSDVMSLIQ